MGVILNNYELSYIEQIISFWCKSVLQFVLGSFSEDRARKQLQSGRTSRDILCEIFTFKVYDELMLSFCSPRMAEISSIFRNSPRGAYI